MKFTGAKIMTLDPGHFHAALVQKVMYDQIDSTIHVYAPSGPELNDYVNRINAFNQREAEPTHWTLKIYTGEDFLQRMLDEKPGNVVVISGNNRHKTDYINACVEAGLNVLADKPMCIDANGFEVLKGAFASAENKGALLYDIMTERFEVTIVLQKELSRRADLFGTLQTGTPDDPAVTKESVHHFFKYVAGEPLKRPVWYFDTDQQGEGIVDVTTHLVDLVQWECFPELVIDYAHDIEMLRARRWPTMLTREELAKVTQMDELPDELSLKLDDQGVLPVYANGEMIYKLNGVHVRISVIWNFQAPEGSGDRHFSIMRGSKANMIIRQGEAQHYRPELYVEPARGNTSGSVEPALLKAIGELQTLYPGLDVFKEEMGWRIVIPEQYRVGHEAHFGQIMQKYLNFLTNGALPGWEIPNMLAKYYTTTAALEMALVE